MRNSCWELCRNALLAVVFHFECRCWLKKNIFLSPLACVASVSARDRRESWEESKKRNDGGGGGERSLTRLEICKALQDRLTFLNRHMIVQISWNLRFCEIYWEYRTAGHLVFWKPWPVTGHIATAIKKKGYRTSGILARGYRRKVLLTHYFD